MKDKPKVIDESSMSMLQHVVDLNEFYKPKLEFHIERVNMSQPFYMGDVTPRSFNRGKRGVAASIIGHVFSI